MTTHKISKEDQLSEADTHTLIRNPVSYNDTQAEKENWRSLAIFISDDQGQIMGGLSGYIHWGWQFIGHLWVAEALRSQGYGTKHVAQAEQEAAHRGSVGTPIWTHHYYLKRRGEK